MAKNVIPKKGIFIVRAFGEKVFHAIADGEHQHHICGCDYREVKSNLSKDYHKRKLTFIHIQ
jgi:hypothetical protein